MVSNTGQTRNIRKRKHRKAGAKRKHALQNNGTTLPAEELFKVQKNEG
jgi:hypothetical protein